MSALAAAIALLGPLLTMEWLIAIERRRVRPFPFATPVVLNGLCVVLTLWLLFGWMIALILIVTSKVTSKRG